MKPILLGYLPPVGGLSKRAFSYHQTIVNIGDIAYAFPAALLTAGRDIHAWNFSMSAEEVNERFKHLVFFIPCRIAEPPLDDDKYPFEWTTAFLEKLKIPFTTAAESVQSRRYEYEPDYHKRLSPKVRRYLQVMADRSRVIGTRGEYSAEILDKLGIKNVEPVGCASLYANGPSLPAALLHKKPFEQVTKIAVNCTNYQYRPDARTREFLSVAARNEYWYVEQSFNFVPMMLYHDERIGTDDLLEAHRYFGGFDELWHLYRTDRLRYFTNYKLWREFLAGMDFVFGARLHGNTMALQAGVPAYFLAPDSRMREVCEFFHLPFTPERSAGVFNAAKFYDAADYADAFKTYPERYRRFLAFLRKNGLSPKVDGDDRIVDYFEPEPAPDVLVETAPRGHRARYLKDVSFLFLFAIAKAMVLTGSAKGLGCLVQRIAQLNARINASSAGAP
ncbi:MAG: polysaccharide pyruvyl transferase family protein [Deltaproteobacteria bacterium]|nr:polysaccharide pyruvyl transferase family protein [Deltaproteobacteria bacterium]